MSYIHDALKKAQKERDARSRVYGSLVSGGRGAGRLLSGNSVWWICLPVGIIFLAFITHSWLDSKDPKAPVAPPQEASMAESRQQQTAAMEAGNIYARARFYHKSGRLQDAARLYRETLGMDPHHIDALNNLGVIDMQRKDFPAARISFEKAIDINPGYVDAHYNLACLHALMGDEQKSLIHLKKAVTLNRSVAAWAQNDTDLSFLRGNPDFETMVGNKGVQ